MHEESKNLCPCEELPPVPQWWSDYGRQEQMRRTQQEAAAFDKIISDSIRQQLDCVNPYTGHVSVIKTMAKGNDTFPYNMGETIRKPAN